MSERYGGEVQKASGKELQEGSREEVQKYSGREVQEDFGSILSADSTLLIVKKIEEEAA